MEPVYDSKIVDTGEDPSAVLAKSGDLRNAIRIQLEDAAELLRRYNDEKPHRSKALCITKVDEALLWLSTLK